MYNASWKLGISFALVAYAYLGAGVSAAQAAMTSSESGNYDHGSVLGGEYWVRVNADKSTGPQTINYDPNNGDFTVTTNTNGHLWYPDNMKGQAWGDKTTYYSPPQASLPIQVSAITSMPVTWNVGGTVTARRSYDNWDAAFEAWFTTTQPTAWPMSQEDGTELMVWLSAYNQSPAGNLTPIGQVAIGGVVWDVRAEWWGGAPNWNYMAYFPVGGGDALHSISTDFKAFLDDAKTRTGGGPNGQCHDGTWGPGYCLYNKYYMTSMQAGFELFGGNHSGEGLTSTGYSAKVNVPVSETHYGQLAWAGTEMLNLTATDTVPSSGQPPLTVRHSSYAGGNWGSNSVADGAMKRLTACLTETGQMDFWGIGTGTGGTIVDAIYHKRGSGSILPAWQWMGGYAKEIACQDNWVNEEEIVYIGTDDRLWSRREIYSNNWTAEYLINPTATAKHIALSYNYPDGTLQLVYTDLNNTLHQIWETLLRDDSLNCTWGTPIVIPGATTAVQLALDWNFDGTITLAYVAGTDSKIHYRSTTGYFNAGWSTDATLSGTPAKQVALRRNFGNNRGLFYVGTTDSKIYYRTADMTFGGTTWSNETLVNNGPASQLGNSGCGGGICGGSLFYSNPNGKIYYVKQTQQNGAWSNPQDMNATAAFP